MIQGNPAILSSSSIHTPTIIKNGPKSAQHRESQKRAHVQCIEYWWDYIPEEIQIGIAQVPNRRQGLALPGNVGEPAEQNSNHQNPTVDVKPLGQARRHHRQRRVQVPAGPIL